MLLDTAKFEYEKTCTIVVASSKSERVIQFSTTYCAATRRSLLCEVASATRNAILRRVFVCKRSVCTKVPRWIRTALWCRNLWLSLVAQVFFSRFLFDSQGYSITSLNGIYAFRRRSVDLGCRRVGDYCRIGFVTVDNFNYRHSLWRQSIAKKEG